MKEKSKGLRESKKAPQMSLKEKRKMKKLKKMDTTVRLKKLKLGVIDDLQFKESAAIERKDIKQRNPIQKRFS
jgi:hypothetical protein